jgi:hypothetical protein
MQVPYQLLSSWIAECLGKEVSRHQEDRARILLIGTRSELASIIAHLVCYRQLTGYIPIHHPRVADFASEVLIFLALL